MRGAALLALVNAHRAGRGLPALRADPRLDATDWKARQGARFRDLGHDDRAPPVRRPIAARASKVRLSWAQVSGAARRRQDSHRRRLPRTKSSSVISG